MDLWASPPDDRDDPVADFREVYFDPVTVNGDPFAVADLVARAGAVHRSYADLRMEVVHRLETPDRIVIGFWMRGRHVGPLSTPGKFLFVRCTPDRLKVPKHPHEYDAV